MKTKLLILAFVGLMCSCTISTSRPPDGTVFSKNFVQTYYIPSEIEMYQGGDEEPYRNYACMEFQGERFYRKDDVKYNALAEKYNDMSYNGRVIPGINEALGVEYSAINITCDVAFDEEHPAGESLGDVVMLCATSFKKFIESGYGKNGRDNYPDELNDAWWFGNMFGMSPVFKLLNEVTREDLILVEPTMYLYFTKIPAPGEYEFTINVLVGEGESEDAGNLTTTVRMTF